MEIWNLTLSTESGIRTAAVRGRENAVQAACRAIGVDSPNQAARDNGSFGVAGTERMEANGKTVWLMRAR